MNNLIELTNLEKVEYCMLNRNSGDKRFYLQKEQKGFTGLYFRYEGLFVGLYPTQAGPVMF